MQQASTERKGVLEGCILPYGPYQKKLHSDHKLVNGEMPVLEQDAVICIPSSDNC
jgi:hypothetical protein